MRLSKLLGKNAALVAVLGAGALIPACSEDPATSGGGSGSGGKASGGTAGGAGVVNAGGAPAGGSAGAATGGVAGAATGGVAGAAGIAGTAGTAGGGGDAGTGGAPAILFDFETDVQGWSLENGAVAAAIDPAQFVTGANSLKVTLPAIAADASEYVYVNAPALWPGAVITLHVWTPVGTDGLYVQGYTQVNNYGTFTAGTPGTLVRGAWTTMTVTVPPLATTFPGGFNRLGVQIGVGTGGVAFAGGDIYIDSITAVDGTADCNGTDTGAYDFEAAVAPWVVDNGAVNTDTTIAMSATQYHAGANSMAVTFTNLPVGTVDAPTSRQIILPVQAAGTKAYCGDAITAHVWIPTGSEQIKFQVYGQYNNYGAFTGTFPATYTYDGWTMHSYTMPAVGPGGIQSIGIQFQNTGAAYTGTVYVDDVTW